ncbi:unnamed protein product [Brassica napus]|uniref:(rape) hypothetical protein n=1 Tax=Brassica napus TaxID=3708 RepID=A0A816Y2C2_BRANA|nr:unnamed protein product [Brassica napus]
MGTPNHRLSSIEFQPQCETNPPMAGLASTALCGAQPIILPISDVRSRNPSGRISSRFVNSSGGPIGVARRRHQMNRWPLLGMDLTHPQSPSNKEPSPANRVDVGAEADSRGFNLTRKRR